VKGKRKHRKKRKERKRHHRHCRPAALVLNPSFTEPRRLKKEIYPKERPLKKVVGGEKEAGGMTTEQGAG